MTVSLGDEKLSSSLSYGQFSLLICESDFPAGCREFSGYSAWLPLFGEGPFICIFKISGLLDMVTDG